MSALHEFNPGGVAPPFCVPSTSLCSDSDGLRARPRDARWSAHGQPQAALGIGKMRTTISAGFRGPRNKRSLVTAVVERQGLLGRQLESEAETTGERRRSEAVPNSRQTDQKEVLGMPERSSAHHMEASYAITPAPRD
jgi:hypothetical protein